jgi:hypothetical protein
MSVIGILRQLRKVQTARTSVQVAFFLPQLIQTGHETLGQTEKRRKTFHGVGTPRRSYTGYRLPSRRGRPIQSGRLQ